MPIQSSGQISKQDIVDEFGGTAPHAMSEYYEESTKKVNGIATRIWAGIRIKDIFSQETLEDFDA